MADLLRVAEVVHAIAEGLEGAVLQCMDENHGVVGDLVREQLYSGVDGKGEYLSPSYDNDPYFKEEGPWKGRAQAYKKWKYEITPPMAGIRTHINARPYDIPNLFIDGTFHSSIKTRLEKYGLDIYTSGFEDGPTIERKYGEDIFMLTDESKEFFNLYKLRPHLEEFFRLCGYD